MQPSTLGQKIIDAIIAQGMFTVALPDPDESHLFVWSANAAEQLEAVVYQHIKKQPDTWESEP